jgi:Ribosomal protein L7/L12
MTVKITINVTDKNGRTVDMAANLTTSEICEWLKRMGEGLVVLYPEMCPSSYKCTSGPTTNGPNNKIEAIKLARNELGISLKDAKDFVDGYTSLDLPERLCNKLTAMGCVLQAV